MSMGGRSSGRRTGSSATTYLRGGGWEVGERAGEQSEMFGHWSRQAKQAGQHAAVGMRAMPLMHPPSVGEAGWPRLVRTATW